MAKSSKLSSKTLRIILIASWAGATITAGIGIGLLIRANTKLAQISEDPLPVATSSVTVASASTPLQIVPSHTVDPDNLQTTLSSYQVSDSADALQPGFVHFGLAQGTKGTEPVH